ATCTATCGPVIYRGGLFGPDYQENAFIPEPSGNLVKRVLLSETGGVVTGKNALNKEEFLTSSDERFRPVNALNGPDGGLYIVDMGRGVIQHKFFLTHYLIANIEARKLEQPVNLGRIWRIVPDNSKPAAVKLPREPAAVVPFLDHANGLVRDLAQQFLVERADLTVIPELHKLTTSAKTPQGRAQALATLEGFGPAGLAPEILTAALKDPEPKVRATAVMLSGLAQAGELLAMTAEPDAEVRVQLALQLASLNFPGAPEAVAGLLAAGGSPLLNDAIACGGRGRELEFLELILTKFPAQAEAAAGDGFLQKLASCVMAERRVARVARLLDLTAAQPAESPQQVALVRGIAGISAGTKAKPQPRKLLYFENAPASLTKLSASRGSKLNAPVTTADGTKVPLLELAAGAIAWPGKAGVPPPPVVVPLTPAQQQRFEKGKVIYATLCGTCHQATGTGMEGLAPPLLDSDWVLGPADRPVRIILHGLNGPVPVAGRTWDLSMPPLPLPDEDIASVLTYLRREWEHNASPVEPATVTAIREAHAGRTQAWTAKELKAADGKKK
ncbi:MAG: hypothetical protein JWL81_2812, partial [Verrucomicrobiales bacterium]|nr:hypothetical protein [Verrucomicrobiales bacterium]